MTDTITERAVTRESRALELREQNPGQEVFLVPVINVERIEEYAKKMNRKAAKLGLEIEPVTVEVLSEPELLRFQREIHDPGVPGGHRLVWAAAEFVSLTVKGETPVLPGWTFIGTIDRLPDEEAGLEGSDTTVFRMAPGEEIPEHVKDKPQYCDHCKVNRRRNLTYLVRHDETNEVKQVGSTCIKDYLGHRNAEAVAEYMQWWLILFGLTTWDAADYDDDEGQKVRYLYCTPEEYLPWVAMEIRLNGWVSGKDAYENWTTSSAHAAMDRMLVVTRGYGTPGIKLDKKPEEQDHQMARDAIEFVLSIPAEKREAEDYWYNLYQLIDHGLFHIRKHRGIVGSAIRVWQIELEKRAREARMATVVNAPYGDIGTRYDLELEVLMVKDLFHPDFPGERTSTLCKFQGAGDAAGHLFVWFASNLPMVDEDVDYSQYGANVISTSPIHEGAVIKCRATIRDHRTFQGTHETVLTRLMLSKPKETEKGAA